MPDFGCTRCHPCGASSDTLPSAIVNTPGSPATAGWAMAMGWLTGAAVATTCHVSPGFRSMGWLNRLLGTFFSTFLA